MELVSYLVHAACATQPILLDTIVRIFLAYSTVFLTRDYEDSS